MSSNWPPALKSFVNETFAKCNDRNRAAVEKELKAIIFKAFEKSKEELWKIDWSKVELESLKPSAKKRKANLNHLAAAPSTKVFIPTTPASYGINSSAIGPEDDRREKRARRFENASPGASSSSYANNVMLNPPGRIAQGGINPYMQDDMMENEAVYDSNVLDWDRYTIVGTSQVIEKQFLRLTSVPNPATIRPLAVCRQTFAHLQNIVQTRSKEYSWIRDQFKSLRQDLIVQRIKNEFAVQVYEFHGRLALAHGDLGEFNQCQGQLKELYQYDLPGSRHEFLGYRILYLLYSRNRAELNSTLANITSEESASSIVAHALAVRRASSQGNYAKFFRLYEAASTYSRYLMRQMLDRERVSGLVTLTKGYLEAELTFIVKQFVFQSVQDALEFLGKYGASRLKPAVAGSNEKKLDCKSAHPALIQAMSQFTKVDIKGQV